MRRYSIKETAQLSGLAESTLRYYETMGLIGPIGRDASSGHRSYGEDDVNRIVGIACLSATGMSIADMRKYLGNAKAGNGSAAAQKALLENQRKLLAAEAEAIVLRQKYVETKIDYWSAVESGDEAKKNAAAEKAWQIGKKLKNSKK